MGVRTWCRILGSLWLVAVGLQAQKPAPRTTFYKDVAPIVWQSCSPCHRPGEAAPFSLLTYEDVRKHAPQVASVVANRYMPPWLPEAGHGEFAEERRLTDEQIRTIRDWAKSGAPAGVPAKGQVPPKFSSEWQLGPPDLVVRVSKPYKLKPEGTEVFWNFIIPVPITTTRWARAMEVRPGNPRAFHHANVVVDRSGGSHRQESAAGEGFEGMDLTFEEDTFDPDGHFLSWKPGSAPNQAPDGMAWRADPGMSLVLNVHLKPTGKPEEINPEIGLYFTDKPQTQFPMLMQLEHDGALDIPAGDPDFVVTDELRCEMDVRVMAVYPHAHYLGKVMEAFATLPDGTLKWLVRIPNWDLNWQGVYRLKEPLVLPRGTVISMKYHYDNSKDNPRNPSNPPQPVKAGNRATDEMSHFWLQVLPVEGGDRRPQLQASLTKRRLEKYPDDFGANYAMGDLLLTQGDALGAAARFEKALSADPRSVLAATECGIALFTAGKLLDAELKFRQALFIDPTYTDARYDLASVEAANAEYELAAGDFAQVIRERPDDARARQHLGEVVLLWGDQLAKRGRHGDALARYREASQFQPGNPVLHGKIGAELAGLARLDEAEAELNIALKIDPRSEPARQTMDVFKAMKGGK